MDGAGLKTHDGLETEARELIGELPRLLVTAGEAYPVLESLLLSARREMRAGFRVFDPTTPLYGAPARKVGRDWWDLLLHALHRGVDVSLTLSDFDPIVAAETHRKSWRTMRLLVALGEVARSEGAPGRLDVTVALHPARVAGAARLALYTSVRAEIAERAERLRGKAETVVERALAEMPGLASYMVRHPRLAPANWRLPELVPVTHHQKMAVFDRERLYIGGLDLNERRYDTPQHDRPGAETWHDVQVVLEGDAARDADDHLRRFLDECARRREVEPDAGRLLRTLSRKRRLAIAHMSPDPAIHEIEEEHLEAVRKAERFVYLESQFFRSRSFAKALADAGRRNPDLSCILVLPVAPEEVALEGRTKADMRFGEFLQVRCLRTVKKAMGERFLAITPARPANAAPELPDRARVRGAPLIYVHAKVSVFDDAKMIVSSANLNGRSFRWDTETGVAFDRPETIRDWRQKLMAHWLPDDAGGELLSTETAAGAWRRLAHRNAAAQPDQRRGFVMPYDIEPAAEFGMPVPGVPEEMV